MFEKPEERVNLAHYFWDQFMEIGEYCIAILCYYNFLKLDAWWCCPGGTVLEAQWCSG